MRQASLRDKRRLVELDRWRSSTPAYPAANQGSKPVGLTSDDIAFSDGLLPIAAVHAEGEGELFEPLAEAVAGRVHMLGFGDELHLRIGTDAEAIEHGFEAGERLAIDDEQLVLVELNLLRRRGVENGDAG